MSGIREENLRLSLLKVIADAVAEEMAKLRAGHTDTLLAKWREEGTKSFNVALGDGTKVATITLTEGKARTVVADPGEFSAWVADRHPDAITRLEHPATPAWVEYIVDGKAQTALLEQLAIDGEHLIDPDTGETVPGVRHETPGEPKAFSVRYAPTGRDAIVTAWRSGELDHLTAGSVLPQIGAAS